MARLAIAGLCVATLAGCATQTIPSKVYDMKAGKIYEASFLWKGDGAGPVTFKKDDEVCAGEYRTILEGRTTVGLGSSAGPWGAIFGALYSGSSTEKAQRGVALLVCPSTITFECEYITNVGFMSLTGHGACRDNRGETYRVMF